MTNQELERRLADALSRTALNDLEGVLSRCKAQKGNVIQMTTKKKNPLIKNLIAACLILAFVGGCGGAIYQQSYAVASIVSLDVNPSIELEVNKNEKVLTCTALNEEATKTLADMNGGVDLKGTQLDVAVNAVVGALVCNGYLDSISSAILISVEDKDQTRAAKLQQELTSTVDVLLQEKASDASVLSQTVSKDTVLEKQAKENNISTGKASLINQLIPLNSNLKFNDLAALSVEELKDLLETGAPGMPIGKTEAARLAIEYADIKASDLSRTEVDAELDDALPHYEVDLYTSSRELEYDVDAYSGKILQSQSAAPAVPSTPNSSTPNPADMVGETAAFNAAAADFYAKYPALSGRKILNKQVDLDRDYGKPHYDVEFLLDGYEADYEVDAYTGRVLSCNIDYEKPVAKPTSPTVTNVDNSKAKSIALAHAGLNESQVTWIQVEKDEDDGRIQYEIEFKAGGMEYEYTIDASTGSILEHEKDLDD